MSISFQVTPPESEEETEEESEEEEEEEEIEEKQHPVSLHYIRLGSDFISLCTNLF